MCSSSVSDAKDSRKETVIGGKKNAAHHQSKNNIMRRGMMFSIASTPV